MNQNYNFVRGLFSQESNTRNENLAAKKSTSFKSLLLLIAFAFFANFSVQGQTYFTESFEGSWYLNGNITTPATNAGPNAPAGWGQKRMTVDVVPVACLGGSHDWSQSTWSAGTTWLSSSSYPTGCSPYGGSPTTPPDGTKSLWFYDGNTSGTVTRIVYSPAIDLSASIAPVFSCSFSYAANSTSVTVVGSLDGGVTWTSFGALSSTTSGAWASRTVAIPASFRVANARIGLQMVSTYGSYDVFVDNVQIREGLSGTATAIGGLWSNPATWVGGVLPELIATIPSGSIVTVDQAVSVSTLNISGTVQWNATANALTVGGNLTINSGGKYLAYTTASAGTTTNIGGNFQNNGYANFALGTLNFNGSGSTLSGTGFFEGDGTRGIIRSLVFQNLGSNSIATSQNLTVTAGFTITAGSLNTNGKVKIDNTAQIYGQALNLQVASVAVTNMGSLYTAAPVVFGQAVVQYADLLVAILGTRYVSGNNVYLCTTAGTFNATPPTSTAATTFTTSGPTLIWIGTSGTLGTNVPYNGTLSLTTQYFYGENVYQAILATATTTMPVHTSGTVGQFRYLGPVAKASVNFDSVTGTVRSLNLTQAGSGFSTAPSIAFSVGNLAGTGSGATATAVLFQLIAGPTSFTTQKSGATAITGGLTINSDQGASIASTDVQASSGVGNISTINGGLNYTGVPLVGFAGPPTLNLVTNAGSGYTIAPTVVLTGGTLISGTALATTNFTITMNQGKVVSVYLNTATSATYSVPPTLTFSAGTATLAFPTGCWPSATANLGSNGQITSFTMTNAGFGYAAAPTVGVGTTSGNSVGGTFTTLATAPTARIALYNLTLNFFAPAVTAVVATDDASIPTNRKMNTLSLSGSGNGLNLTNNLTLFGTAPLSLTASANTPGNILDLGGYNLLFTWNGYAGSTASTFGTSNTFIKNGSMTLTGRGGGITGSTFNFPFSGTVTTFTGGSGSTAVTAGTDILTVKVTEVGTPGNTVAGGTGIALGSRAFKIDTASTLGTPTSSALLTGGTNSTVKLNYNSLDALISSQDQTFVVEASSLNGAWNVRSAGVGASGALAATGNATTSVVAPGPVVYASGNFYAWGTGAPTIAGVIPTVLCANSGFFSITGTNFSGVTSVKIGGTAVLSFTVVNATTITGYAGPGTSGNISITKNGLTVTGIENITITPSPSAPSVTTAAVSINLGGTVTVTASGGSGTFKWYDAVSGGTLLYTGPTFSAPVCSGNIWVGLDNGSCEGLRTMVTITTAPTAIVTTATSFCGTGSPVTLSASPTDASITYSWTSLTAPATVAPATGGTSVTSTLSQTSDFRLTATKGTCTAVTNISIGVYALPSATVTTTAQGVCPGTSATIGSGLVAGNFAVTSVPYLEYLAPTNAVVVCTNGVPNVPLSGGTLDDGGWSGLPIGFNFNFFGTSFSTISAGTNGLLMFGTPPGYTTAAGNLGQYSFNTTGGVFPNALNPGNVIALMAADQYFGSGTAGSSSSTLTYWTQGYAPNRIFVIEYSKVDPCCSDSALGFTAQARLYETLGTVDIAIVSKTGTAASTVGLQDATKTIGAVAPGRQAFTSTITTPEAWRFAPPSNYTTSWYANSVLIPAATGFVNPGTNVFNLSVAPAATTTYSITYVNQTTGCSNAAGSAQVSMAVLGNTIPAGLTTNASATTICTGQTVNFSTSFTGITDGMVFQWQNSTDGGATWVDITSANTLTYSTIPTIPTKYRCKLVACSGVPGYTNATTIGFANSILSSTPGLRCGTGTATAVATGSAGTTIKWYANASGGAALGTGTSFVTPSITATTTYYAGAETYVAGALPVGLGATNSANSGQSFLPGYWGGSKTQYIIKADELLAAGIGAGNITSLGFEPTDSGQTYQGFSVSLAPVTASVMTTAFIAAGLSQVYAGTLADTGFTPVANTVNNLTFGIGTGSASTFNWDGSSNILVSIARTSVPAATTSVPTTMKVDNVNFNSTAYYLADNLDPATMLAATTGTVTTYRPRFTINGQVVCSSVRVPVVVTVTTPPSIALSGNPSTICAESNSAAVTVTTGGSNYTSYVWTPTTVTGNLTNGWVFNPLTTTTYTLAAAQTSGATPCATTASITVTVNPTPSVLTIAPASASTCADSILPLVSAGGTLNNMTLLTQNFNGPNNWTTVNNSTGGTPALADWTMQPNGYVYGFYGPFISNDSSQFYMSNSDAQGSGGSTSTELKSPVFSTVGFSDANLSFYHYLYSTNNSTVDYTLDGGTTWVTLQTYTGTQGAVAAFTNAILPIPAAALNQPSVQLRFKYTSSYGWFWAIDNVSIAGTQVASMVWSPTTNLYTDAAATTPYTGQNLSAVYFKTSSSSTAVTYTATATSPLGCARVATVPVTVYLTPAPTGLQFYQFCPTSGATVSSMTTAVTGTNIKWYSVSTGGTVLASTTPLTQGYFWASQTANGCESPSRFLVFAISNATAAPSSSPSQQFCNSATVASLTANGTGIKWYTVATGGTALVSTAALSSGTYYVSQTAGGCESPRTAVSVTVNAVSAPTGAATQSISSTLTLSSIVVTGTNVVWYATSANAAAGVNPLPNSTLLANTTYYATQTIGGCTSATSLAVTITTLANQDFDMTKFNYYPNPVINLLNISYSQDMTSVKVFNMVGQQLMSKEINASTTQIDMSRYANGAYFIQVTTENAMKTVRVIKK